MRLTALLLRSTTENLRGLNKMTPRSEVLERGVFSHATEIDATGNTLEPTQHTKLSPQLLRRDNYQQHGLAYTDLRTEL